jgi:CRP-like cAMP-binding protein
LSVLDGRPRVAQVVAAEPTICLALASWDFEAVVMEQPSVALAILRGLAGRLRDLTETDRH